jgi:hypothetical protein
MPESTMRKMVKKEFDKDDVEGLKKILASLRKKVANHDADQAAAVLGPPALAPAPSAPAASPAPPISRPDHPINLITRAALKRPRPGTPPQPDALLESLRLFAFEYGKIEHARLGSLDTVPKETVYKGNKAFLASLPECSTARRAEKSLHHYFDWDSSSGGRHHHDRTVPAGSRINSGADGGHNTMKL